MKLLPEKYIVHCTTKEQTNYVGTKLNKSRKYED